MRLLNIEKDVGGHIAINVDNICSIYEDAGTVLLRMACGHAIATKFTDVEYAIDYIQRAPSVSMGR